MNRCAIIRGSGATRWITRSGSRLWWRAYSKVPSRGDLSTTEKQATVQAADGTKVTNGVSGWGFHDRLEKKRERKARKLRDAEIGAQQGDEGRYIEFEKLMDVVDKRWLEKDPKANRLGWRKRTVGIEKDWQMTENNDAWITIPKDEQQRSMTTTETKDPWSFTEDISGLSLEELNTKDDDMDFFDDGEAPQDNMSNAPLNHSSTTGVETPVPSPYKPRPLPISPIMDPELKSRREKHHNPKAKAVKNTQATEFQLRLRKNPYARALATPIRRCNMTQKNLPSYFLQGFSLLSHPTTGEPWYMPRNLTPSHTTKTQTNTPPSTQLLPTIYTVSHYRALASLQGLATRINNKADWGDADYPMPKLFASVHARTVRKFWKLSGNANWRPDMHDFILELMRRRLLEELMHIATLKRGYLVGCTSWEDAERKNQVAAYLWTGPPSSQLEQEIEPGPPEFATLDLEKTGQKARKRKIPLHNLRTLLGEKKLRQLRNDTMHLNQQGSIFDREIIALKGRNLTTGVQMKLWKLQGYVAVFKEWVDLEMGREGVEAGDWGGEDDGGIKNGFGDRNEDGRQW